jgi:ribosomal protein S10
MLRQKEDFLVIYPIENQSKKENEKWRMRIHLRGVKIFII